MEKWYIFSCRISEIFREGTMKKNSENENYEDLKNYALREGVSLFGVGNIADLEERHISLAPHVLKGLDRAVSLAFRLSDRVLEDVVSGPTKLYFFHYQRVNVLLDALALKIANFIQSRGWDALPIPASQIIDWEKQIAHISHKHAAQKAGIGWIGRNNLLVTPQFGSRQRLITVLTDMPLRTDAPSSLGCADCRACISSCPSHSIKENPRDFDHTGCYQQIRALVKAAGISQNICGLCVKACRGNPNNKAKSRMGQFFNANNV
jgi:epoxyqueuosine reductase